MSTYTRIAGLSKIVAWISRVFLRRNPTKTVESVGLRCDKLAATNGFTENNEIQDIH